MAIKDEHVYIISDPDHEIRDKYKIGFHGKRQKELYTRYRTEIPELMIFFYHPGHRNTEQEILSSLQLHRIPNFTNNLSEWVTMPLKQLINLVMNVVNNYNIEIKSIFERVITDQRLSQSTQVKSEVPSISEISSLTDNESKFSLPEPNLTNQALQDGQSRLKGMIQFLSMGNPTTDIQQLEKRPILIVVNSRGTGFPIGSKQLPVPEAVHILLNFDVNRIVGNNLKTILRDGFYCPIGEGVNAIRQRKKLADLKRYFQASTDPEPIDNIIH